jgi:BMFP domain-containing protein YqiC
MDRQAFFDDLQHRVLGLLRSGPATDLERNLKALLGQAFQRLELVTREEFELQRELLARTREKLDALEKQVHQFEARQARTPSAGGEPTQDSSHPPSHPPSH